MKNKEQKSGCHLWRKIVRCCNGTCIEDNIDMRLSEDDSPIQPEDAHTQPANHRPPSYNPEDYANALARYSRSPNLYIHDHKDKKSRGKDKDKNSNKDSPNEMSLKQFASLPELLRRLREDLKAAYISFVKELVRDPHDGVTLLVDLLKMIQVAQSNLNGSATSREQQIALRRTLIDEFECLSCLRCCLRCSEAPPRLANHRSGLYPLAAATLSSLTRSRTIALQLLTKACENSVCGHRQVVEAFSTLRLRFAEPVRCKFLVSMMLSYPHPSFQVWSLKLINALLSSAVSLRERVYLQEELGEAGFDAGAIRKALEHRGAATSEQQEAVRSELNKWNEGYIDLSALEEQMGALKSANSSLQQELQHLRQSNIKLLEENVLVKAVGGEVEDRCSALKRRLEKYGIPSAPSPTPSVTDSEVSSFINTGRSTVRRNTTESPSRMMDHFSGGTMSTTYGADGERSTSLEWRKIRPDPEGRGIDVNGRIHPVPKRRNLLVTPELASRRSVYVNDICSDFHEVDKGRTPSSNVASSLPKPSFADNTQQAKNTVDQSPKMNSADESSCVPTNPSSPLDRSLKEIKKDDEAEHIYQSPVKPSRPPPKKINQNARSSQESVSGGENTENVNKTGENTEKCLSSSASSLSTTPSTVSLDETAQKDYGGHEYENVAKTDEGLTIGDTDNQTANCDNPNTENATRNYDNYDTPRNYNRGTSNNSTSDISKKNKARQGIDDGDIDYERNVVVYEAITLGNDTIMLEKNSTNSSNGSNKSRQSEVLNPTSTPEDATNVKDSVRHYENMANREGKREKKEKNETKGILTGFLNGLKSGKKRASKLEKKNSKKISLRSDEPKPIKIKSLDTPDREIEAVIKGLENVNSMESNLSGIKMKENTILDSDFEDRASPEDVLHEIEIVPTRVPQIPPRIKSKGTFSLSSRSHTPDTIVYLDSPSETSDTDAFEEPGKMPPNLKNSKNTPEKSSGWGRNNAGIRRRDTFAVGSPGKVTHKRHSLRRSESVHVNNRLEYNSHRSYSPRRRGSTELLVPLEKSEIQISGRRFTQYTAAEVAEVEHRNHVNNLISSGMKRRRNRSCDDRLDQWLDQDCLRHSRYDYDFTEKHLHHNGEHFPDIPRDELLKSYAKNCDPRHIAMKPARMFKSKSPSGFNHYGPNFILNGSHNPHHIQEALIDINELRAPINGGNLIGGRFPRKIFKDDPAIPTPDYSATPAGTLTNGVPTGRHILEMASGLY